MIIKSIYINHFGCLQEKNIKFERGLNVISLPNESGKSTIAEFIRVMLYGVNSLRFNQRKKYMPFSQISMGGEMTVELDGIDYIIKRTFGTRKTDDKVEVINAVSGAVIKEYSVDSPGGVMCGISGDAYENTCYIKQLSAKIDGAKSSEIQSRLLNLTQNSDEDYSYRNAVAILDSAIKELNGSKGKINQVQCELNEIAIKNAEKNKLEEEYIQTEKQLDNLKDSRLENKSSRFFLLSWIPAFAAVISLIVWQNSFLIALTVLLCFLAALFTFRIKKSNFQRIELAKQTGYYESRLETLKERYNSIDISQHEFLKQKLQKYSKILEDLKEAKEALSKAFEQLQMDYSPKLNSEACKILKYITGGKYIGFMVDENYQITVRDDNNALLTSEYLSSGTFDQIYFSLRMALVELIGENMPVILDDAFTLYDDERLKKAVEYLDTIDNQVILFSCQSREWEFIERM